MTLFEWRRAPGELNVAEVERVLVLVRAPLGDLRAAVLRPLVEEPLNLGVASTSEQDVGGAVARRVKPGATFGDGANDYAAVSDLYLLRHYASSY